MTLQAKALGARADSVCEGPVYVPGLLPGERARVSVTGDRGRVIERLSDAPERVAPFCPVAQRCGGCALQHFEKSAYQAWKRNLVVEALAREGLDVEIAPLVEAWGQGRRRARLHAKRVGKRVIFGYGERAAHSVVDVEACPVAHPLISENIAALRALAEQITPDKTTLDFALTASDAGLDVGIEGLKAIGLNEREAAGDFAHRHNWARVSLNGEVAVERARPTIAFGAAKTVPPAGSFLQATDAGEDYLTGRAMAAAKGAKAILDLYAGSGAFGLRLAQLAPVQGVEGEAGPLQAMRDSADHTPGLKPVTTLVRDLAREPLTINELKDFDCVVIDPPRSGARAQCENLAGSDCATIISVSCNPATFARDGAILLAGGYRMGPVTPVDQFAWTGHVEVIAEFSK